MQISHDTVFAIARCRTGFNFSFWHWCNLMDLHGPFQWNKRFVHFVYFFSDTFNVIWRNIAVGCTFMQYLHFFKVVRCILNSDFSLSDSKVSCPFRCSANPIAWALPIPCFKIVPYCRNSQKMIMIGYYLDCPSNSGPFLGFWLFLWSLLLYL